MPTVPKLWQLLPHDGPAIERLSAALRVSPVVAQLLLNRGLGEPEAARRFLDAPLAGLHPPDQLPGVAEAADRLLDAVRQRRSICVYGDYDVDGITGTVILWQALRLLDAAVNYYVPHRLDEGYGLNCEALHQIARSGASVVVTVDCGIGSGAEAEEARRLGLELIITDHHQYRLPLPAAAVVVHPSLPGAAYPFAGLSGSGVALKLAWALCQRACGSEKVTPRFREFLLDAVGLAALGLVADVVPMQDENRILVRHGLNRLCRAPSLGLQAVLDAIRRKEKAPATARPADLCVDDISYKIAPRLNAMGRLGCARLVVELLTTPSAQRAGELASTLEEQNAQRQTVQSRILRKARARIAEEGLEEMPAIVLADAEWHAGIVGIVASRLVEQYARPVLLMALRHAGDGAAALAQGSGRSVPGFALHEALQACDDLLLSHGGHAAAAGFKVRADAIPAFRERFCAYAAGRLPAGPPVPRLVIDAEVALSALTPGLVADLDRLEPYGVDNRRPLFLAGGLRVTGAPRRVGKSDEKPHLSFSVQQGATTLRAIAFGMGERVEELMSAGGDCCLVFRPRINEWQGRRSVDLEVQDFQAGARAQLE